MLDAPPVRPTLLKVWTNVFTLANHTVPTGGANITVDGGRDTIPLFARNVAPSDIFTGPYNPLPGYWAEAAAAAAAAAV